MSESDIMMTRICRNLIVHELTGLEVKIEKCEDKSLEGRSGTVLDETKNTLLLGSDGKAILVPKQGSAFVFVLDDGECRVQGNDILMRPHERPKKIKKLSRSTKKVVK